MLKKGKPQRSRSNPVSLLAITFITAIFAGTLLLLLPYSHIQPVSFIDALFTATSAICVTGLMTVEVADVFTPFGQAVILLLIQFGGMGIMTASTLFVLMLGKSISIRDSSIIHSEFSVSHRINLRKLMSAMLMLIFIFEALGATIYALAWMDELGAGRAVWAGVFHSVSSFCNAGISIFRGGPAALETDSLVDITFTVLMILGSVGFITLTELYELAKNRKKRRAVLSLHSRVVLLYTFIFIVAGVILILLFESNNVMKDFTVAERLVSSFYHSVSGRTAGFLKLDFSQLNDTTLYMFIIFMVVGGAPGSFAGGIKLTTFAVLVGLVISRYRRLPQVNIFNRSVPESVVGRAVAMVMILMSVLALATFLLLITEGKDGGGSHEIFLPVVFEAASAFGTVGSSMGITPSLTSPGKLIITALMLIGRLGTLSLVMYLGSVERRTTYQLSEEGIMVG